MSESNKTPVVAEETTLLLHTKNYLQPKQHIGKGDTFRSGGRIKHHLLGFFPPCYLSTYFTYHNLHHNKNR